MFVTHVSLDIEGRIDGETRIKHLFERQDDIIEYRVLIASGYIKICSLSNLECHPTQYESHCWKCNSKIDDKLELHGTCGWYICARCMSCGCGFYRFNKS